MSYMTTIGPHNGPPGPLDGCGCARCALGADEVLQGDPVKALTIAGAVIFGALYLTKRATRKR